jgi:hypothetical protein
MNCEDPSARVPARDKQAEEDLWQRHKAERGVWSEPMLAALARGLKGKKWFSLIDKVGKEGTLQRAWEKVRRNAGACGVDGITIGHFEQNSQNRLLAVKEHLSKGTYQPGRSNGCGLKSRAAWKSGRWGYPRSPTAWCRRR